MMTLTRRHGFLAAILIAGLAVLNLNFASRVESGIHNVDSYPSLSCRIPRTTFDGKLLYNCAFQSIMRLSYKLENVKDREAWAKKWEHKFDNDKTLDTPEGADQAVEEMMLSLGERFNYYKNESATKASNETMAGSFGGMGAEITLDIVDEKLIVPGTKIELSDNVRLQLANVFENNAAAKAGLQKDDIITHVDDKTVNGLTMEEAITKIKGPTGTNVKLKVLRGTTVIDAVLTRAEVVLKMVVDKKFVEKDIYYFRIKQFASQYFAKEVAEALTEGKDAKAIILDLRNNPGGLQDYADILAQYLMHEGTYLARRERNGSKINIDDAVLREDYAIQRNGDTYEKTGRIPPMVKKEQVIIVLLNEGSASASEIIAGALQANHRAVIVGKDSHGKGVGQSVVRLPFNRSAAIISFEFYPGGKSIDWSGVTVDVEADGPKNRKDLGDPAKDGQLKAAIEQAHKQITETESRENRRKSQIEKRQKEFNDARNATP